MILPQELLLMRKQMIRMFIDDEREPIIPNKGEWVVIRSYNDWCKWRDSNSVLPNFVSFDHDLGGPVTGYDIAKEMIELDIDGECVFPHDFYWITHTQNPVGAENINKALSRYMKFKEGNDSDASVVYDGRLTG